ncbi:MAG: peptidoglycan recognition family protein, partial [Rhodomicrobium sp.]
LQNFGMKPARVGLLTKPAWGDIPYHFYIDFAGKIGEGRDIDFAGDATTSFDNDGRIQITVEGDFEREQPAEAQLASLRKLVTWLAFQYSITAENISGHGDHDQTNCPGRNLKPFLEDLRKAVQGINQIVDK